MAKPNEITKESFLPGAVQDEFDVAEYVEEREVPIAAMVTRGKYIHRIVDADGNILSEELKGAD